MYEDKLQQLGLTAGEAKVYEALLIIGSSTVGPIVKKAKVAYSNIYEILNRLLGKGLVSFIIKERTKYFQAEEPTQIKEYLDKKEEKLLKNKKTFEDLLPQLKKLKSFVNNQEEAEIFIGEKGLMRAYEKLLENSNKNDQGLFFYVHKEESYETSEKFYVKSWSLMRKFRNKWRGISACGLKDTKLVKRYPNFIEQRYVKFPVPGNIDILGDRVLITTWEMKPIGILIHSLEMANNFRNYFESVWKVAKK